MELSRSLATRAMLAIALMVGYYVLAIGVCVALLWVPYAEYTYLNRLDFRIALACLVGAATILFAIVPRPDRFTAPGPQLTSSTAPQLFAMIDDVASATSQPRPTEVYLLNEVNAFVSQRGGTMGIGSRRVMGVGLPLVNNLTRSELKAVIAHEFGHYSGGDVSLGPWIYKTRAAIGRTLAGLEESFLQSLFNWYARMFMRLTMAVSRQQEFVADETAARVAGAAPMVSALQKVALLSPAYSTYLQHEVLPILRSGFLPPIADGFRRFMASPGTTEAFTEMVRQHEAETTVDQFETHPPLNERVAALERLRLAHIDQVQETSAPLLGNADLQARLLLEHSAGDDQIRQLNEIRWEDVAEKIYADQWSQIAKAHAQWFGSLTVDNLPAGKRAYADMGKKLRNEGEMLVGSDEALPRAVHVMIAGLGSALLRAGWHAETGPGRPVEVRRGDASVIPVQVIGRLVENADTFKEWKAQCDALGITGLPLAATADAAPMTT